MLRIGRAESPFVGRTQALVTLHTLLAQVEAGRGQAVGIVGEPGIGKSRLLAEFYHGLQGRQLQYLHGRCLAYSQATPYLPVLDLLRHSCDLTAADSLEDITAKLHHRLREMGMVPEEAAPYLLALLGVEKGTGGLAELAPEVRKAHTFATLVQFCIHASQSCPLILEVEDLHWSDAISAEWLTALIERVGHVPLLVLGTYRPGYRPVWLDKSYATQVALQPLSPSDSRRIVQALLPMAQRSAALEQAILAKADGNPFFLEELAQTVVEQGEHAPALGVPDTVQAVLAARIDRLPPAEKLLLQIAAVIGSEVPVSLLRAVAELEEERLYRGLAQLQVAEFLYETWRLPEPAYTFKHALTQEVTYQSLLKSTRQQFHQQIAQVLEAQFSDTVETRPELLAQHYTEAGLIAQAVGYWQKASQSAVQRSAHVEAISHLTKGLELLKTLPETSQRLQREVDMHIALGASLFATKGYAAPEVGETYMYAQQLCQHLEDPYQRFPVLRGLWSYYLVCAELQTAHALGEQLLTLAQQVQDTAMLCVAHRALGSTLWFLGAVAAAHMHFAQGMALYDPQQHRVYAFLHGDDAGVICHSYAAWTLWYLGYPAQGLTRSHEAVTLAQQLTHPFSLGWVLSVAAIFHQFRREAHCAQECGEAVLSLATAQGFAQWRAYGSMLRGWALMHQGQVQEGITQLTQGLTAQRATGAAVLRPYFLTLLVEAYGTLGQSEAGLTVLTEALPLTDKTGARWHEPELYRLKGDLLLHQSSDNATEAERCFQHALKIARNQQAKSFELRAVTSLAQLWQQQGRRQEAYDLLAPVYNWFTEGFDTAGLARG
jgi:predicted ATPase